MIGERPWSWRKFLQGHHGQKLHGMEKRKEKKKKREKKKERKIKTISKDNK